MLGRPSRSEFAMLRDSVTENRARLDALDTGGTRGVAILTTQVKDVIADVAELKTTIEDHERQHIASRRWGLGFAISVLLAFATVLTLLIDIAGHVRG